MPDTTLLFFGQRRRLAALYQKWCRDNQIKDCPESLIAFLQGNGIINGEKAVAYLNEKRGVNTDV